MRMNIKDKVKVIGGNNETGQPTMLGKFGVVSSFGATYQVKGKDTFEVFVDFENFGTHCFNDYHLESRVRCANCDMEKETIGKIKEAKKI